MGMAGVPADECYGAQTARSLIQLSIYGDRMPKPRLPRLREGPALVKPRDALPDWKAEAIVRANDEAIAGRLDEHTRSTFG